MHQILFRLGLRPDPAGEIKRSPDLLAGFNFRGLKRREEMEGEGREGNGKGGEGMSGRERMDGEGG